MLTPERWQIVERLFHEALSLAPSDRSAFLRTHRSADAEVRAEVESLLAAESESDSHDGLASAVAADWMSQGTDGLVGRTVEGYTIISLIGAGGMGEVFLAEEVQLGRRVALKLLPTAFIADPGRLRRFTEEARAASALNHPGILTVFRVGHLDARPYIVSEFIDGQTVRERLATGPLPLVVALDVAIQVAAALQTAHGAGIVHRDIKPENIMIRRDGYVKVLDFGLAKLTRGSDGGGLRAATRAGAVIGTLDYMAPEQAAGEIVDERADIYSFAVVLHEMLTGTLPREFGSASHQSGSGIAPLQRKALRVLRRGLASDPSARYQTVAAFQADLEALRRTFAGTSLRAWFGAAAVAAAAIIAAGVVWWRTGGVPSQVRSLVVMPMQSFAADPDQAHLEAGIAEAIVSRLVGLPQLRVPPSAAVRATEDPFEAAHRLGVDAVLTGSVQRSGDELRITAQLTRTLDKTQIWASRFDEPFTDIFRVEDTIAERIAASILTTLSSKDRAALTRRETQNPEAYDLYLRAREQWSRRSPESIRTAIRMYQDTIALDPKFALAYSGLADCYNISVSGLTPVVRHPLAREAAEQAVALDPRSGEAHNSLAFMRYKFEWRWADAEREFARAIELAPNYVLARHWFAEYLGLIGHFPESIAQYRRALELDPLSIPIRVDFLPVLTFAGRISEARAVLDEGYRVDPNSARLPGAAFQTLVADGREAEAIESELRGQLLLGVPQAEIDAQRQVYRTGGIRAWRRKRVESLLAQLRQGSPQTPGVGVATRLAMSYADEGNREETLRWLAKGIDLGEDAPLHMMQPPYDFVRGDPRFQALIHRVGLDTTVR
jgi:serine/threonine-protein kinase